MRPEGVPLLASFLLFREEKSLPEVLSPCPLADVPMCLIGQIWVTWPPVATGRLGSKNLHFSAPIVGGRQGQKALARSTTHYLPLVKLVYRGRVTCKPCPFASTVPVAKSQGATVKELGLLDLSTALLSYRRSTPPGSS